MLVTGRHVDLEGNRIRRRSKSWWCVKRLTLFCAGMCLGVVATEAEHERGWIVEVEVPAPEYRTPTTTTGAPAARADIDLPDLW